MGTRHHKAKLTAGQLYVIGGVTQGAPAEYNFSRKIAPLTSLDKHIPISFFAVINAVTKETPAPAVAKGTPRPDNAFLGVCLDFLSCLLIQSANTQDQKGQSCQS